MKYVFYIFFNIFQLFINKEQSDQNVKTVINKAEETTRFSEVIEVQRMEV